MSDATQPVASMLVQHSNSWLAKAYDINAAGAAVLTPAGVTWLLVPGP